MEPISHSRTLLTKLPFIVAFHLHVSKFKAWSLNLSFKLPFIVAFHYYCFNPLSNVVLFNFQFRGWLRFSLEASNSIFSFAHRNYWCKHHCIWFIRCINSCLCRLLFLLPYLDNTYWVISVYLNFELNGCHKVSLVPGKED